MIQDKLSYNEAPIKNGIGATTRMNEFNANAAVV